MKKTGKAAAAGLAAVLSLCLVIPAWATGSLDDAKKKKSSLEEEKKKTEAAIKSLEGLKSCLLYTSSVHRAGCSVFLARLHQ